MHTRPLTRLATLTLACLGIILTGPSLVTSQGGTTPPGPVSKDPRFETLVPTTAKLERLADGFRWSEGPVWNRKTGALLFSDVPNNVVHRWREGEGLSDFLRPSGYTGSETFTGREPGSNGLTFDAQGRLVLCQHGDRRVARMDGRGRFTTLADRYDGKRLNSPNDLVYRSNGDLYFTDPPYGLPETFKDPRRELDFTGVYRLSNGRLTLLVRDLKAPNGIAFSPDEKTLYVAQSDPVQPVIMAYPVNGDGTVGTGRVLIDTIGEAKAGKRGLPDGLKVDEKGNLFATGPGGVLVIAPDGTHLGTIETGVPTANVAWGDDGTVLYITANDVLYRVRTTTKGRIP